MWPWADLAIGSHCPQLWPLWPQCLRVSDSLSHVACDRSCKRPWGDLAIGWLRPQLWPLTKSQCHNLKMSQNCSHWPSHNVALSMSSCHISNMSHSIYVNQSALSKVTRHYQHYRHYLQSEPPNNVTLLRPLNDNASTCTALQNKVHCWLCNVYCA